MTFRSFPVRADAELVTFGDRISAGLSREIAATAALLDHPGVRERVPSYTTLSIEYDASLLSRQALLRMVNDAWQRRDAVSVRTRDEIVIPVVYDGPDLGDVARQAGITPDEVARRHSAATYTVGAVGFSPGFGYLIGLPPELATPRRAVPRIRVPAGSVAIGGGQTAVYPVTSAGGWNLIGRTDRRLFDPAARAPFLFQTGDRVRFQRVEAAGDVPVTSRESPVLRVGGIAVMIPGLATTVQDAGRHGLTAFGVAPNGALDATALRMANVLVGNAADAAGLEIVLTGPTLRFRQGTRIAVTGEGPDPLLNGSPMPRDRAVAVYLGDEVSFAPGDGGTRAYLAVRGGIDVPLVMGSRSTDVTAGFGGFQGRALRAGDVLPIGRVAGAARLVPPERRDRTVVRVVPGPQRAMFSDAMWRRFVTRPYTVTNDASRMGVRLTGPALRSMAPVEMTSEGVVTGSVQVPPSGQPIVLLAGRATIGGYPKVATVVTEDLDLLGQWRPGDVVRFVLSRIEGED